MNESSNKEKKTQLVDEVGQLLFDTTTRYQSDMETEKQTLLAGCTDNAMRNLVRSMTVTAFHILDAIGRLQPTNSIEISKRVGIPKGTVSKNLKKLIANELIVKTPLPNNKKESILQLTPLGFELFDLHAAMHKSFSIKFTEFLGQYEPHELNFIIRFLKNFQKLSWLDLERER